ncbi:LysM peptidoglycan-binding domain-containing protein [Flavobacteriaceae bacterium]|nr:LysM peptidoglycan-binding domain-containing protein [Flavobacteriaceae bacterium]
MKNLLIFAVVLVLSFTSFAQNLTKHSVKAGESIDSIAKLYKISTADIYTLNPDLTSILVVDSVLFIPESTLGKLNNLVVERELDSYKVHKVRRKETLFSIAQKYDISIEDLKTHNESLQHKKLRRGKKIYIPVFKNNKKQIEEDQFSYYTVKASEGYYRLEKKLGLSKKLLLTLNPELEKVGLKLGMVLKVPKSSIKNTENTLISTTSLRDSLLDLSPKNLALLLPFKTKSISINSSKLARKQLRRDGYINIATDFYSGAVIAIDSAKRLGISVNLDIFDTNAKAIDLKAILNQNNFSKFDAVLGPITLENLELTAEYFLSDSIPVVSPFVKSKSSYLNLFQTIPDTEWLRNKMVSYVKTDTIPHQTLIIYDSKSKATAKYLKTIFPSATLMNSKIDNKGVEQFYLSTEDVQNVLLSGRTIVFLESDNESFISNVTSMLNAMNGITIKERSKRKIEREIILMTTSYNKSFEGLYVSNYDLSNLNFHYPSVNHNMELSETFKQKYLTQFGTFPNKYAIRGFDLTLDILLRLSNFGSFFEIPSNIKTSYIANKFNYIRQLNSGFKNEAGFILKHQDLEIIKVQD